MLLISDAVDACNEYNLRKSGASLVVTTVRLSTSIQSRRRCEALNATRQWIHGTTCSAQTAELNTSAVRQTQNFALLTSAA